MTHSYNYSYDKSPGRAAKVTAQAGIKGAEGQEALSFAVLDLAAAANPKSVASELARQPGVLQILPDIELYPMHVSGATEGAEGAAGRSLKAGPAAHETCPEDDGESSSE